MLVVELSPGFGRQMGQSKAHGKSKAMAAKTCNSNIASTRWRGQLHVMLPSQKPPALHVPTYLLLCDPLGSVGVAYGNWWKLLSYWLLAAAQIFSFFYAVTEMNRHETRARQSDTTGGGGDQGHEGEMPALLMAGAVCSRRYGPTRW